MHPSTQWKDGNSYMRSGLSDTDTIWKRRLSLYQGPPLLSVCCYWCGRVMCTRTNIREEKDSQFVINVTYAYSWALFLGGVLNAEGNKRYCCASEYLEMSEIGVEEGTKLNNKILQGQGQNEHFEENNCNGTTCIILCRNVWYKWCRFGGVFFPNANLHEQVGCDDGRCEWRILPPSIFSHLHFCQFLSWKWSKCLVSIPNCNFLSITNWDEEWKQKSNEVDDGISEYQRNKWRIY